MKPRDEYYLVDESLAAYPLRSLLSPEKLGDTVEGLPDRDPGSVAGDGGPPVPITPDGQLVPGVLYDSSADPGFKYYLPKYRLDVADGRYTTRLKWRSEQDDPGGPLAFLTIDVSAEQPEGPPGTVTQEVEHQAVGRIAYRMPVRSAGAPAEPSGSSTSSLAGDWRNIDLNTGGMTRLVIAEGADGTTSFHGYGACVPTDCDWGVTSARQESGALVGVYEFGWKRTRIAVTRQGGELAAEVLDDYAESDGRTDRTSRYVLARSGGGEGADADAGPTLWIEVGELQQIEPGLRRGRLAISEKSDFDRLYQIMTDESLQGSLEIRAFATAGVRTWRQIVIGRLGLAAPAATLAQRGLHFTEILKAVAPKRLSHEGRDTILFVPRRSEPPVETFTPLTARADPAVPLRFRPDVERLGVDRRVATRMTHAWTLKAGLGRTDLRLTTLDAVNTKVPDRVVLDQQGEPALMRVPVETRQSLSPFCFPVATNAYVFDVPGDMRPTTHHILLRHEVISDDGRVLATFYQDSAFPEQFYYQPQEFRLARQDVHPYTPDMRMAFFRVVSEETVGEGALANLLYRVQLAFRALPYIDPSVLTRARTQVAGSNPRFTALMPESSKLSLRIPLDEANGALTEVPRTEAEVSFAHGIVDTVELSQTEFERVLAFFGAGSGTGLEGAVDATLIGNTTTRVPLTLSFTENAGELFDHTYLGPQGGGRHRVTLRNRIESAVRIARIYPLSIAPGITALPQTAAGTLVPPGGTVDLEYALVSEAPGSTPDAAVSDIEPVLSSAIEADLGSLYRMLFVNAGYTSDTFSVHVSINPVYFDPPSGGEAPLTGVRIEFPDSGVAVILDASEPQADVQLRIPLLARILQDPNAQQYSYEVVNLHGDAEGARARVEKFEGDLEVQPAPLQPAPVQPAET